MKISTKLKITAAFVASLSSSAFASPETFIIDGTHTFPRFSYNHFGYTKQLSRFNKTTGTIVIDKEAKTGSVDVTIDMKSVDTGFGVFDGIIRARTSLTRKNTQRPHSNQ